MLTIRPYQPEADEGAVSALWQNTLGHVWPIPQDIFHFITVGNRAYRPGDHLAAFIGNDLVGFVGYQAVPPHGALLVLLVSPQHQRAGIGSQLHTQALAALKERGCTHVQLASGALFNFWPGIPLNLPSAWYFFQSCGWAEYERTFDLACDLHVYKTPSWVMNRVGQAHITIDVATHEDIAAILAFEALHFPQWLSYYQQVISSTINSVVVAKHVSGSIVGTSFLRLPPHMGGARDLPWTLKLGENTGGVGPLGVAEPVRGRGVGLALAAKVTELLQARNIATSYVGYTWLVDWYAYLGYSLWSEYRLSRRIL